MPSLSLASTIMINVLLVCSRNPVVRAFQQQGRTFAVSTRQRSSLIGTTSTAFGGLDRTANFSPQGTCRFLASESTEGKDDEKEKKRKYQPRKKGKFTINPNIGAEHADNLAAAFDELARKDGFDSSLAKFSDDGTFGDDFDDDDFMFDADEEDEEDDEDDVDLEGILDAKNFDLSDFEEGAAEKPDQKRVRPKFDDIDFDGDDDDDDDDDDEDDFLDFGGGDGDMDARIAAAQNDMASGRVTVPEDLDRFSDDVSEVDLKKLGFKKELNPFGNDETPRKAQFKLISNAKTCTACGSDFQSRDETKPGYLPSEKFEIQQKLVKIEEMQALKVKAETLEWTPEDEIEFLIQTSGGGGATEDPNGAADLDIDSIAAQMGLDLVKLAEKKVICKRCHGLQNSGKIDDALRPGWTEEPTISQDKFRNLLKPISEKPAVIIALVDLFDFSGSVLRELDGIAGDNPVILAANKADLLPAQMGKQRAENWVRRELEYLGVKSIANIGGAVRLVSCKNGDGIPELLSKARSIAEEMDCDVYVVGAANAGKSTLINYILGRDKPKEVGKEVKKLRAGNRNSLKGEVTTSPLPGTTLKFIKVDLGDGKSLYDTPGLLVPGTFTQLLTTEELKIVCPKKQVEPITFRVSSGKCVLVGGLAKIEVIGDSRPFLFTFFVANEVKLHPTDSSRADEFIKKHAGVMLTPPLAPGPERMEQLGEFDSHVIDIEGTGWKEAAADISLTGLGWIAVTGAGSVQVRISVPKGIGIAVRPPLMPFDIWEVAAKYTGSKAVRKPTKTKSGNRRKGVGRN